MMEKEIKEKLIDELLKISNDSDFILGVLVNAKHFEDRLKIIEFIENGKDVSYENIILLSLELGNMREAE